MSSIDTTGIDASKPTEGEATTQSVRDNFASIKTQLGTAKTELSDLSGVTDQPTARTNIGAGTISTQDSASVSITGGSITGVTDIAIADGGTGASDAPTARTNLGLGTLATQDDPATASTYIKRNAGNTAYDAKTPSEVLADLQAARHDDLFADWVISGLLPATSTTLTSDISAGAAYVTGRRITKTATSHTYTASVDTYVDIDNTGTYLFAEVATGGAAPAQPASSIRLAKVVTDAAAITSVVDLRETERTFPDPVAFPAQYACRAYQSTLQSVAAATWTKVLFQTEVYDVGGGYDPSTSIYTVPADGMYLVSSAVAISTQADGDRTILEVYVDGVAHSRIFAFTTGGATYNTGTGSTHIKLTKGQQVAMYLFITTAKDTVADSVANYLSIYRMG